jgi:hypothetical protein
MKRVNMLAAGLLLLGQIIPGSALAMPVTYAGTTVDFSFDDALLGLFGTPTVAGNALFFTPVGFSARSLNGAGYALANETMNIRVSAHDGFRFSRAELTERGDYLLLGTGSTADVAGQIRIFDVLHPSTELTSSIQANSPLSQPGVPTRNWTANAAADLSTWTGARQLNITIENLLLASTTAQASVGFVEKKFAGLSINTAPLSPVPEAETWAMMLAGLGLVGWSTLRRRRASSRS